MKNGNILKGRYIYSADMAKLRVVSGKNAYIFDSSEVDMITRKRPARQFGEDSPDTQGAYTQSRFFSLTELGVLAGNPDNSQSAPLVMGSSINYTLGNHLSAGAGIGVEFLKETYLPVSANLMYRFREARFTPYAVMQAGYQIPVEESRTLYYEVVPDWISSRMIWPGPWPVSQAPMTAKGGLLLNPAVGFINHSRSGYGFSMSVGYRFHKLRYAAENDYKVDVDFNRLSVKLGLIIH